MDQATELSRLAPADAFAERVTVKSRQVSGDREVVNETEFVIRQFTFHQYFQVISRAERIFNAIQGYEIDLDNLDTMMEDDPIGFAKFVMFVMGAVGPDVEALIALAIGKPADYLNTVDPDEGIRLAAAVFRTNKNFFVQRILPILTTVRAEAGNSGSSGPTS